MATSHSRLVTAYSQLSIIRWVGSSRVYCMLWLAALRRGVKYIYFLRTAWNLNCARAVAKTEEVPFLHSSRWTIFHLLLGITIFKSRAARSLSPSSWPTISLIPVGFQRSPGKRAGVSPSHWCLIAHLRIIVDTKDKSSSRSDSKGCFIFHNIW